MTLGHGGVGKRDTEEGQHALRTAGVFILKSSLSNLSSWNGLEIASSLWRNPCIVVKGRTGLNLKPTVLV